MRYAGSVAALLAFAAVCVVLLSGGLAVTAFTATGFLATAMPEIPDADVTLLSWLIIAFFMLGLAPLFEWWFKLWRTVDRWCIPPRETGGEEE